MDQLWSYMPPSVAQLIQANGYQVTPEHAQWAGIAVVSLIAVYVGYLWSLSLKEAAVTFNVPVPVEVRNSADGKQWETVTGMEKCILENQVRGIWNEKILMSYCPADGRVLGNGIKPATVEDVDAAVQAAKVAQQEWAKTTFAERRKVLRSLLKYVLDHQDDIVTACCLDSGKTKVDASFGEILVTVEKLKWTIDHGEKALLPSRRPTNLLMMYKNNLVTYEPLGVVAAAVSWNYPFHNFIGPIISALFAGNSIVVKPSEQTAWSTVFFLDIVRGALSSCGHSRDLVQSVVCLPAVADKLTSHPDIAHITFIGSRPVAHKVCASAAKALIPVCVELGGKDPSVILDDARTIRNLPTIASILMRGVFQSAGQNCIGIERVIALPGVYEKLIEMVTPRIRALRLGSILLDTPNETTFTPDMGAMISPASFDKLEGLIAEAVGQVPTRPLLHPTLLVDVTPQMRIAQEELFAPVFLLMRAENTRDAISIANSTLYSLGASVFGHHPRDVDACVRGINAGMMAVNDFGAYYVVQLPFGGVKGSGYGRFAGDEGLRSLCNTKALCLDKFPKIVGTAIPPRVDYPIQKREGEAGVRDGVSAWEMCKGINETGYQITLGGRIAGILRLLKNM
ncbi:putative aldehyde dehydrogenase-like protein [Penicillium oxalicum]|uniref:putative aldehyde dehydrogenase-like protein n=1 Tax=Penicillium oxalicum TaxID=69781 RepID=UPI0020B88979|nr:putative aldehyde dehydrogenase-like protein [Penicillium oxalicum]KAI2787280.1 putative aldehyde dehydrogenase-like protein [Penicillium oxalicum]